MHDHRLVVVILWSVTHSWHLRGVIFYFRFMTSSSCKETHHCNEKLEFLMASLCCFKLSLNKMWWFYKQIHYGTWSPHNVIWTCINILRNAPLLTTHVDTNVIIQQLTEPVITRGPQWWKQWQMMGIYLLIGARSWDFFQFQMSPVQSRHWVCHASWWHHGEQELLCFATILVRLLLIPFLTVCKTRSNPSLLPSLQFSSFFKQIYKNTCEVR